MREKKNKKKDDHGYGLCLAVEALGSRYGAVLDCFLVFHRLIHVYLHLLLDFTTFIIFPLSIHLYRSLTLLCESRPKFQPLHVVPAT